MTPRMSIVVPFYGVEEYIGPCLDSLRHQTMRDFEVILVDDGSPDGSRAVADEFAARDRRFRVVEQPNQGLGPARNTGVAHASGDFITFVDSDDLVPWRAYERMLDVLESTGSSFVGGNARRFNRSGGVRQSWAHLRPFGRTQLATHITASPDLVLDRMVWNKVYRRTFWDEHAFAFPAIRYEDYPVTLPAHLQALTVDALSEPVYYWRERESGDSITQQTFRYDNLADRVSSAEMVFDSIAHAAQGIRSRVHAHLAEIDLSALVQAFEVVPDEDVTALVSLGHRFVDRLDPAAVATRPRFDRVQYAALRAGDVEVLRELAAFRSRGELDRARVHRRRGRPWVLEAAYPGLGDATIPRTAYRMPRSSLSLRTTVTDVRWGEDELVVRGTADIRHVEMSDSDGIEISLITTTQRVPVPVRSVDTVHEHGRTTLRFEATVAIDTLRQLPWVGYPATFQVRVRHGYLRRSLPLRGVGDGSPRWPGGVWLDDLTWVQSDIRPDGALRLTRTERAGRIDTVLVDEDVFVLRGRVPGSFDSAHLLIARNPSRPPTRIPATCTSVGAGFVEFEARVRPSEISDGEVPDDPYTLQNSWPLRLISPDTTYGLLWTEDDGRPYGHAQIAVDRDLYSITTGPRKWLIATREPVRVKLDSVTLTPEGVDCCGPWWPPATPQSFTWRHFLPNSDDHVDVSCDVTISEGRWRATVGYEALGRSTPDEEPANWSLFTRLPGAEEAVVVLPRAGSTLPLSSAPAGGTPVEVSLVRQTLHVRPIR